ncbi:MAG: thioredoxin-like domain-containing protein, partial [Planctomycetota bacterium]
MSPMQVWELPEGTTAAGLRKLTPLTNLKHLGIWQMRYTDDGLGPLRQFKNLQYLSLMTGITDEDLAAISALTSLEELIMNSSPITNKGLAQLAALKSLKRLTLHHGHKSVDMDITVSGVGALKGLPLKYLQLGNIKLDESRYSAIGAFAALEFLYLSSMPIIDEDLAVVGKLSQLKRLLFNTDTVSDGGLEYLAGLNRLEDFQPLTPLTDKGLYHIGKMRMKGRLIVKGHFTDEGLRYLEGLSSLRQLKITTSGEITDGAKERLKRKLPNLSIYNVQRSREVRRRPKVGEAAPPFALKPLDQDSDSDEEIRLEGKAVLLYFWATWCTPCKASTPALKQLYAELKKRHADRFVMLGLSLDSDETSVRRYIGKETIPWPQICIGRHSKVAADYGVTGVPMYYVIGPDQRVVFTDHDNGDTIEAAVDRALQDKVTSVRQAADEPIKRLEKHGSISEANHLEILDVKFEPIHQGKNVVRVNVQNTSGSQRIFAIHIYTRSTDYAPGGIGWGTRFFDTIKAKETKWSRFVFKIHGPVTDNTWLRLKFYNPASEEDYDYEKPFKQRRYESSDLIHEEDDERGVKPASTNQTQAVIEVFEKIQAYVREQEYEQAWQSFTKDYQEAEFQTLGLERFTKAMDSPAYGRFMWDKQQFLDLHPKSVTQKNGALSLTATVKEQNWKIDFLQEDGRWKIDWITGYRPAILDIIEADAAKVVDGKAKSELELLDVRFEPIRQGKNVVQVKVSNTSDQGQVFRLQIYTRSPDYGRSGVGWGTSFFDTIKPKEAKWTRFVFKIQGPVTDATYVRLDFHNPGPAAGFDREKYFEDKGPKKWFKRVKYSSSDLEHHKPDEIPTRPASESESEAAVAVFREIQKLMTDKKYEQAWELLTKDYQDAEFQSWGFKRFKKIMEPQKHNPIDSAFWWQKAQFLRLQPESVVKKEPALVLSARDGDQTWKIDFVQEDRQWKVDWIAGYTLRILQWQNWETRLLGKMEKRNTKHFDIHYEKASVAEKEIDEIAKNREAGYSAICEFLGQESQVRIKLVLFENERTKWFETGHQGRGWAYGNTTVEVYNEREQLDPYHETTHVLMRSYGGPPALFNEGFAVYMSEHLGAHALEDLGGGQATIYERVRELKKKAEWIELEELIAYTEIGSRESRPPVAYAEAASFV